MDFKVNSSRWRRFVTNSARLFNNFSKSVFKAGSSPVRHKSQRLAPHT